MADMISLFKDETVMDTPLNVVMINAFGKEEDGVDNNGVFLDALSSFWAAFYESCTNGEEERAPVIRHDFQVSEWESIGRIIVKGYKQVKFFPVRLNRAFMTASLFGESAITNELLTDSFLAYLSKDERELIKLALNKGLDKEHEEEWLELLDRFGCKTIPNAEQVGDIVLEIAHKELVQTPRYIIDSWSTPLLVLQQEFQSPDLLQQFFERENRPLRR